MEANQRIVDIDELSPSMPYRLPYLFKKRDKSITNDQFYNAVLFLFFLQLSFVKDLSREYMRQLESIFTYFKTIGNTYEIQENQGIKTTTTAIDLKDGHYCFVELEDRQTEVNIKFKTITKQDDERICKTEGSGEVSDRKIVCKIVTQNLSTKLTESTDFTL